jgi:hypothetical protein
MQEKLNCVCTEVKEIEPGQRQRKHNFYNRKKRASCLVYRRRTDSGSNYYLHIEML